MVAGAFAGAGFSASINPVGALLVGIAGASVEDLVERGILLSNNSVADGGGKDTRRSNDSGQDPENRLSGSRRVTDPTGEAGSLANLGTISQDRKDLHAAEEYFTRSLELFRGHC